MLSRGMSARAGWVYLVGAGPGDPGLLTLRAAELLQSAELVLHDELLDQAVLEHVPATAEIRGVGKRGADPASKRASQDRINQLMIEEGRTGFE